MQVVQYKCPHCGADLTFNADKQAFECEYCDSSFTQEDIEKTHKKNEELDLTDKNLQEKETPKTDSDDFAQHNSLYLCPSCGAEIITEETTAATFCYYCHSPVTLTGRISGELKPSKIIPFKISRETAQDTFKNWCFKKWFVPKDFKSQPHLEKISGIYIPFWLADCNINGYISASCKKVNTWTTGNTVYTHTKVFECERGAKLLYKGLPADGSSKADDVLMECIEPYNYDQLVDFSMSYLTGFLAEKYDVTKEQVQPRIEKRATENTYNVLKTSIEGFSSVNITNNQINVLDTKWDYMLLPVWFLTYIYKNKHYDFALNGQTGKMSGSLPVDNLKLGLFAAGIGLLAFLVFFIGGIIL